MLGRRGGANFLLKCHALRPICLTFLVIHFYTYIYVSILNLWRRWCHPVALNICPSSMVLPNYSGPYFQNQYKRWYLLLCHEKTQFNSPTSVSTKMHFYVFAKGKNSTKLSNHHKNFAVVRISLLAEILVFAKIFVFVSKMYAKTKIFSTVFSKLDIWAK